MDKTPITNIHVDDTNLVLTYDEPPEIISSKPFGMAGSRKITVFILGSPEYKISASQEDVQEFKKALEEAKTTGSLVWNGPLEIQRDIWI